jgi:hypothetical protein
VPFQGEQNIKTIEEFCILAEQAVADPAFFDEPVGNEQAFERQDEWLKFPSDISTDVPKNNVVWAKITDGGSLDQALVIFHHWNASAWNGRIAGFLSSAASRLSKLQCPIISSAVVPDPCTPTICLAPTLDARSNP